MNAKLTLLRSTIRDQGRIIAPHKHNCFELVYYFSGGGQSDIGGVTHTFGPSHYSIIPPDLIHDEQHEFASEVLFIGFTFDPPEGQQPLPVGIYPDRSRMAIPQLLTTMKSEFKAQMPYYSDKLNYLTGLILVELFRIHFDNPNPLGASASIQYARAYLDEYFHQKVSIQMLADLSDYSYDRFRHLFKAEVGCSPIQYLFNKRTEFAKTLLAQSNLNIASIAMEAGFSSESQFCAIFKREEGVTPRQYRKSAADGQTP